MGIAATTQWMLRPSATANMLNGGGFNTANINFLTNWTVDAGTGNTAAPVVSSASYNFVAGDVGAWIFVKSGTNWTPGFYQIASVASNKATINAAIGAGLILNTRNNRYDTPNTAAGIATVATPTSGTIGVDYSRQDAADTTATDYAAANNSTTMTSASAGFKKTHAGNIVHLTTTGSGTAVVGWYEIISVTNTTTAVTDRPTNSGGASTGATGYIGGAVDLAGTLANKFTQAAVAGNITWVMSGAYTLGVAVDTGGSVGDSSTPSYYVGFTTLPGDACNNSSRPVITCGANSFAAGTWVFFNNIVFTGTAAVVFTLGGSGGGVARNCKFLCTSVTASRVALSLTLNSVAFNCEAVSMRGAGVSLVGRATKALNCYTHDSDIGISTAGADGQVIAGCVSANNVAAAIKGAGTGGSYAPNVIGNTLYGSEAKVGVGIDNASGSTDSGIILGNLFYGFVTGFNQVSARRGSVQGAYNNFYNNTTDVSLYYKDATDTATNPAFTDVSQITGTNATTSGSVLTSAGADFSAVIDNQDYVRIISGTGKTAGKYLITNHTADTLTLNLAPGDSATADGVFSITIGHNFKPTVDLAGFPGAFPGSQTVGGTQIGAVQRPFVGVAAAAAISAGYAG